MSNQHPYEIIEAFLDGSLTGAALTEFEERLKTDKALAEQVRLFQNIDSAVGDKPSLDFQKMVLEEGDAFLQKSDSSGAKVRRMGFSRRQLAIAATLLVLVVSAVLLWQMQSASAPSGAELYAQNFQTYPINENLRGGTAGEEAFKAGIRQYQSGNFNAAAQSFQTLSAADEQDMVLAFCLAQALLNQQPPQHDMAEQQLQKIIAADGSIYVPKAKWYMALIHLQRGETADAKTLLEDVAQSGDQFAEKAGTLLEEL